MIYDAPNSGMTSGIGERDFTMADGKVSTLRLNKTLSTALNLDRET